MKAEQALAEILACGEVKSWLKQYQEQGHLSKNQHKVAITKLRKMVKKLK